MSNNPRLPDNVKKILTRLMDSGYSAYIVGGCVRDSIMGRVPTDWDITTSAHPDDIKRIFPRHFDSGSSFGTITVLFDGIGYEVTTYRIDGEYKDSRHPLGVAFASSLSDDLSRRDFTINAIAYNDEDGYVDLFNGIEDIKSRTIRGVGNPSERFMEDALRMLRAVRFSAQLGFCIEEDTYNAICRHALLLQNISVERIRDEFCKILLSPNPGKILTLDELGLWKCFLPEISPKKPMCKQLESAPKNIYVRLLIMLNHECRHIKADEILRRMRFDGKTVKTVSQLLGAVGLYEDIRLPEIKKTLRLLGTEGFKLLLDFYQSAPDKYSAEVIKSLGSEYTHIIQTGQCLTLKQLALNGHDLKGMSFFGEEIGEVLEWLLAHVYCDDSLNTREALTSLISSRWK